MYRAASPDSKAWEGSLAVSSSDQRHCFPSASGSHGKMGQGCLAHSTYSTQRKGNAHASFPGSSPCDPTAAWRPATRHSKPTELLPGPKEQGWQPGPCSAGTQPPAGLDSQRCSAPRQGFSDRHSSALLLLISTPCPLCGQSPPDRRYPAFGTQPHKLGHVPYGNWPHASPGHTPWQLAVHTNTTPGRTPWPPFPRTLGNTQLFSSILFPV
ncbi:unnamed protein product [Lepidochelys kempii]